jgi:hypothetical protein
MWVQIMREREVRINVADDEQRETSNDGKHFPPLSFTFGTTMPIVARNLSGNLRCGVSHVLVACFITDRDIPSTRYPSYTRIAPPDHLWMTAAPVPVG